MSKFVTYAYRGLLAIVLFLIGKKKKIAEIILSDENTSVNMDTNDVFNKQDKKDNVDVGEKISYRYEGTTSSGKKIKGTFDAYNIEQAKKFLTEQNEVALSKIAPRGKYDFDISFGSPISVGDLSFALTQLATYIRAGIPLVDSVRILSKQSQKPAQKKSMT